MVVRPRHLLDDHVTNAAGDEMIAIAADLTIKSGVGVDPMLIVLAKVVHSEYSADFRKGPGAG